MSVQIIRFAPGLKPVLKHQEHDQKTHGNWATEADGFTVTLDNSRFENRLVLSNKNNQPLAYVEFQNFEIDKKIDILYIQSYDSGKGYATRIIDELYRANPDKEIYWGKTSAPESTHLAQKFSDKYGRTEFKPWGEGVIEGYEWGKLYGDTTVKKHQEHDQKTHGSWATGGSNSVADQVLLRAEQGKSIDLGSYPRDRKDNPDDPHGYKTDAKKMGEVIHSQGWDKGSIGLTENQFEDLATNPDFERVYRGAPSASVQAMIDGEPYIGNGAVGPGTYVSLDRSRAEAFVTNKPDYKVIEMLAPRKLLDKAATRTQQQKEITEKYGKEYFYDSDAPQVLSASRGIGATWNGEWTRFPSDYVIYNTSALIVKVDG